VVWVALWVLLVLVAAAVFALLGRSLWRRAMLLLREAGESAERLGRAAARIEQATGTTTSPEPAVFERPAQLRRQRAGDARRARGRHLGRTVR
jgi:hypothetical protein